MQFLQFALLIVAKDVPLILAPLSLSLSLSLSPSLQNYEYETSIFSIISCLFQFQYGSYAHNIRMWIYYEFAAEFLRTEWTFEPNMTRCSTMHLPFQEPFEVTLYRSLDCRSSSNHVGKNLFWSIFTFLWNGYIFQQIVLTKIDHPFEGYLKFWLHRCYSM